MYEKIKKMCKRRLPFLGSNPIKRLEKIEAHLNKLETLCDKALDEQLKGGG